MMWWIVLGVLVAATVVFAIFSATTDYEFRFVVASALCAITAIIILSVCVGATISNNNAVAVYRQHMTYIETHVPSDPLEDAALTSKKIELNDWLFHAQYMKSTYGAWSLYPETVLDLEPIK